MANNLTFKVVSVVFLVTFAVVAGAQDFVVTKGKEDIKNEIKTISLMNETSVQKPVPDKKLSLGFGLGSVNVAKQRFSGKGGSVGYYEQQDRPQIGTYLNWIPLSFANSRIDVGLTFGLEYFNLENGPLALHFVPVSLGPKLRANIFESLDVSVSYQWTNVYVEQVGLDEATGSDWVLAQKLSVGLEIALARLGIGDDFSRYNLGLYYQESRDGDSSDSVDLEARSVYLVGSVSL